MKWYRLAAERGYAEAQVFLGNMYGNGDGVARDYVLAHMWINLAVARWPPGPIRDELASARDKIEKHMTPDQVAEAQRLAREWKPK